jgi:hypothetical protein
MRTTIPATFDTPTPLSSLTSHRTVRGDTPGFFMQKNQALNVSYATHSYHTPPSTTSVICSMLDLLAKRLGLRDQLRHRGVSHHGGGIIVAQCRLH